ncbi:Putative Multiple RNA-binding domain-containing protein 1 [Aspergillus calidoustus]|uniref:Putative Multiple RNA-binding domain-containing protein 1 n=1 Tax=Aspergillus calidoustus TaxID=454130 RepID=A0A0U5G6R2_ASPCI|nr:Putative Multiple RNA-binding domain-containing protein 1 [Aspergillus calidoustus]
MESTRVFVSGLPPTLTNDQLKKHFATRFQVTDAHVLPKRRIGFVGFKSSEVAQQAVSYFNKTYMKMSKISVDIAKPIDAEPANDAHKPGKNSRTSFPADAAENSLKRKRDEKPQDPKVQEYLSLLQQPSKTKTWANDDQLPTPVETNSPSDEQPAEVDDAPQELTYAQRKKAKLGQDAGPTSHVSENAGHSPTVDGDAQPESEKTEEEQAGQGEDQVEDQAVSDSDWLRSKTSRLLGLLDEDEQVDFAPPAQTSSAALVSDMDVDTPAESTEQPTANGPAKATEPQEVDTNIENIRISARLFVRNLSYDTEESDLEPVFAPFGKIEEIHVAFDTRFTKSKGFAYIQYVDPDAAVEAYKNLDGKHFQGRLLHILPASQKKTYKLDEHELSKLPLKKQKQIKRKQDASSSTFSWNSLYMNVSAPLLRRVELC